MIHRQYPTTRLRRPRRYDWSRRLTAQHRLSIDDLIWPLFVMDDAGRQPIGSLPGVDRLGEDEMLASIQSAVDVGIPAVALFPATPPELKTEDAAEAFNADNLVCRRIAAIKKRFGDAIGVIADDFAVGLGDCVSL